VSSMLRVSGHRASESSLDDLRLVTRLVHDRRARPYRWIEGFDVAKLNLALGRRLDVDRLQVPVNDAFFVSSPMSPVPTPPGSALIVNTASTVAANG
jgi:hypothetical protein